jgi:hypothetical protein
MTIRDKGDRDFIGGNILLSRRLERLEEVRFTEALGLMPNLKFGYPDAMVASGIVSVCDVEVKIYLQRSRGDKIVLSWQSVPKGTGASIVEVLQQMVTTALNEIGFPSEEVTGKFESD